MARYIKRFIVIHGRENTNFVDALRGYAVTHATPDKSDGVGVILEEPQEIARILLDQSEGLVTQGDVGAFLGKDQTTISRWTRVNGGRVKRSVAHA